MSSATRTPEAEGLDVVLVGSFNPAIFHPEWFFRQGIVAEQDAKEAIIQDGGRNKLRDGPLVRTPAVSSPTQPCNGSSDPRFPNLDPRRTFT